MKDGRVLPCAQFRQLDDLAIRQFERVMVDAWLVLIDLRNRATLCESCLKPKP